MTRPGWRGDGGGEEVVQLAESEHASALEEMSSKLESMNDDI